MFVIRLLKVLPSTTAEMHGVFITEIQIFDQALIANKAIEDYRICNQEVVMFKIDF